MSVVQRYFITARAWLAGLRWQSHLPIYCKANALAYLTSHRRRGQTRFMLQPHNSQYHQRDHLMYSDHVPIPIVTIATTITNTLHIRSSHQYRNYSHHHHLDITLSQPKTPPPRRPPLQAQKLVRRRARIEIQPLHLAIAAPQTDIVEPADRQAVPAVLIAQPVRGARLAAVVARVHETALFPAHEDVFFVQLAQLGS